MTAFPRGRQVKVPNVALTEDDEVREWVAEQCLVLRDQQGYAACLPEPYQVIPEAGAWIIVRDVPHTNLDFDVPLYSIWRARPHTRTRTFKVSSQRTLTWPMMLAEIQTPGGDLVLYPTEYVVTDIAKWLDLIGQGVVVNFIGAGEPGDLTEQLFYMQAHGLKRADALVMLLPDLTDERFVYLTLELP